MKEKIHKSYDYLGWAGYQIASLDKIVSKEKNEEKRKKYANTLLQWLRHYENKRKETIKDLEDYFKQNQVVDIELRKIYKQLTKV